MAEKDLYDRTETPDALNLVLKAVSDCERDYHNAFVEKVEARYDAYRGLVPQETDDRDWHSNITAPYVLQTVEGMLATMLEPHPHFKCEPRPRPEEEMQEVQDRIARAASLEEVLDYALERDKFSQKQRAFMQQDLIAGVSVMKDYWRTEKRDVTRLGTNSYSIEDAYGNHLDTVQMMEEQTGEEVVWDDACMEVRDVRDFFWPATAPSVEKAEFLIDRTYESMSSCERKAEQGHYKNIAKLRESGSSPQMVELSRREQRLRGVDRTKNMVEILEYWTPERVITVGNRAVVLNDRPNPFWLGRMPFVVCSAMPDAFQIPGISVVEALAQLQEMLWTLQNQRLDVLRMVANMITLIRSDVDDPEAFEWAPNAQWFVEDPGQVSTLPIDPTAATITLQAEALLKGDLQNIMGGLPMSGGVDSQTIDQETATGVSIITSIAQRIIQARKQHYLWAFADLGKHFLLLWQQFLREERVIRVLGSSGSAHFKTVTPMDLQGDFEVSIDVTSDSLMRQERRAEAMQLFQMAAQAAPLMAQFGQAPDLGQMFRKVLDAYDIRDSDRFFSQLQAPPGQAPPLPGLVPPGGGGGAPNGAPSNGVTNPQLAAGPMSPSGEGGMTISPEAAMQRFMAMRGQTASG